MGYKPYAEAVSGFFAGKDLAYKEKERAKQDMLFQKQQQEEEAMKQQLTGILSNEYKVDPSTLSGLSVPDLVSVGKLHIDKKKAEESQKQAKTTEAYNMFKTVVDAAKQVDGPARTLLLQKGLPVTIGALQQQGYFKDVDLNELQKALSVAEDKEIGTFVKGLNSIKDSVEKNIITKQEGEKLATDQYATFLDKVNDKNQTAIATQEIDRFRKGLEPAKETAMTEADEIKQALADRLGRKPTSQEYLDEAQRRKAEIAREGRSTSMQSIFVDPETGRPLIFNRNTNTYEVSKIQGDGGIAPRPVNPSAVEREKTAAFEVLNSQLDRIEKTYKSKYVGLISGQAGRITQFTDEDESAFRQVILDVKDSLLRARSGAQINEQEYRRLARLVPDFTDSEPQFKGKMKSFRATMDSIVGERKEAQRKGGVKFTKTLDQNGEQAPSSPQSKFKILKVE
uniref:Uncharacterized protein n=1 Tax=viral metagenome TaxID=1070528 RepID=A0A6H1ZE57_9ZZZZ